MNEWKLKCKDTTISDSNLRGYKDLRDRKICSRSIDILRDLFVYAGGTAYTIVRIVNGRGALVITN
jgi:hypothetical protein